MSPCLTPSIFSKIPKKLSTLSVWNFATLAIIYIEKFYLSDFSSHTHAPFLNRNPCRNQRF